MDKNKKRNPPKADVLLLSSLGGFAPQPDGYPPLSPRGRKGTVLLTAYGLSPLPFQGNSVLKGRSSRVRFAAPYGRALDEKAEGLERKDQIRTANYVIVFIILFFRVRLLFAPAS